ncbi:MAG: VWA domain-containing protein [Myxococcales bacterium]|nr:VWA domain-containing protein [Myxococcales bacterium]
MTLRASWLGVGLALAVLGSFQACAAGGGATTGSAGEGGSFNPSGSSSAGGSGFECAIGTDEARLVPLNLYIMYDKSGSMLGPKWTQSTAALQAFFMDPTSAGLFVALRFFPDDGCDAGCNVGACAQPLVPLGELTALSAPTDVQEDLLINAFVGKMPAGATPLSAALDGALQFTASVLDQKPNERAAVVLVTDGDPSDCHLDEAYFVNQAGAAYAGRGILTFAIGLEGSNPGLMNAIASAGGTGQGFFIGTGTFQDDLVAALQTIRESAVACEYQVPDQADGFTVNPDELNVLYTPSGGGSSTTIGQVPNLDACAAVSGGWYYDDPLDPTKIIFCPSTCAAVQGDLDAEIELLFGCATIPA